MGGGGGSITSMTIFLHFDFSWRFYCWYEGQSLLITWTKHSMRILSLTQCGGSPISQVGDKKIMLKKYTDRITVRWVLNKSGQLNISQSEQMYIVD
jgi:hypothetical protein